MVGMVVVSHSPALAASAVELAQQMVAGAAVMLEVAAGVVDPDGDRVLGTDATEIAAAVERVLAGSPDGVLVLLDLGSAVLSAELALELLPDAARDRVRLSAAPLVEGLIAAAVSAAAGGRLDEVADQAAAGLAGKQAQLEGPAPESPEPENPETENPEPGDPAPDEPATRGIFIVDDPHGLHARPAAQLVAAARRFAAAVTLTDLSTGHGPVPASGFAGLATLGATYGHRIEVAATGPQAAEAVSALLAIGGVVEGRPTVAAPRTGRPSTASPGFGIGAARVLRHAAATEIRPPDEVAADPAEEVGRLSAAIAEARQELEQARDRLAVDAGPDAGAILEVQLLLLADTDLLDVAQRHISAGRSARAGWQAAADGLAARFAALSDPYLRGRAADVHAVAGRVTALLSRPSGLPGGAPAPVAALEPGSADQVEEPAATIVLAAELTPMEVAQLDRGVRAVVLTGGGPTTHAALLARARGIPMLVGADPALMEVPEGTLVAVDADRGEVLSNPSDAVVAGYQRRQEAAGRAEHLARSRAAEPAVTADGSTIPVLANVGSLDDAERAVRAGADGIGLVRTEFLFAGRPAAPTVAEQVTVYRAIAAAFPDGRVVFRALDAGADKPLPFLPTTPEANPFLGVRGLRLLLQHPNVLGDQLRALAEVAGERPIDLMFPMVTRPDELLVALELLDDVVGAGRPAGLRIGIMVEVPAVALRAAGFVDEVDFFSVGTNDLAQYALAAERGNPALAALADPLDSGVLELIRALCAGAADAPVSVCGDLASDPLAVAPLLAAGVTSLSVVPSAVAAVKEAIRRERVGRPGGKRGARR